MHKQNAPDGISILLCTHNGASRLMQVLKHLSQMVVPEKISWEILLIDNASTDETSEVAREFWPKNSPVAFRVIYEGQLGLRYARQRGIAESRYEYFAFVDDDNWLSSNWVEVAFEVMSKHKEVSACGGLNIGEFESPPPDWISVASFGIGPQAEQTGYVSSSRGFLWGAGLVIRRQAYNQLCQLGFAPRNVGRKGLSLDAGEDEELTRGLALIGGKLWYEERLTLKHFITKNRVEWDYFKKLHQGFGRSCAIFDAYKLAMEEPEKAYYLVRKNWLLNCLRLSLKLLIKNVNLLGRFFLRKLGNLEVIRWHGEVSHIKTVWKTKADYGVHMDRVMSIRNKAAKLYNQ